MIVLLREEDTAWRSTLRRNVKDEFMRACVFRTSCYRHCIALMAIVTICDIAALQTTPLQKSVFQIKNAPTSLAPIA